jgi:hypothetical protein
MSFLKLKHPIGNGEVDSSILSGSTSRFLRNNGNLLIDLSLWRRSCCTQVLHNGSENGLPDQA